MAATKFYHAVGKRKTAIARVYLTEGTGQFLVNNKPYNEYFELDYAKKLERPFRILEKEHKGFDAKIRVLGGGTSAQAEACMFGISKAMTIKDSETRGPLKKAMLLTRDSRIVERKKYGHKKARKSYQFSKR